MNQQKLEYRINYTFQDKSLLEKALTHASIENTQKDKKRGKESNQRLEFLGDAVLDAIISNILYHKLESKSEGTLTRIRSGIVCEEGLYKIGMELNLGEYINLSFGEEKLGGRKKKAVIADAVEALVGAIFIDAGYEKASELIEDIFKESINYVIEKGYTSDYKSALQEKLQQKSNHKTVESNPETIVADDIKYNVIKEEGPAHDKTFYVEITVKGERLGEGVGKNKKEAEQQAAKMVLEKGV